MDRPNFFNRIDWMLIGLLTVLTSLAFLPQVGNLGYYHDDWFTTISRVSGLSLFRMHLVDRPAMGLWYSIADFFLGESPLAWHLFAFFARLVGSLGLYILGRLLWPGQRVGAAMIAIVHGIYPGFLQQTSANNYQNHIIAYSACILSILLTVLALQAASTWKKVVLSVFAIMLTFIYPQIYEAMIGMEGFRFLVMWLVISNCSGNKHNVAFGKALIHYIPYLLVVLVFLYWRFFVFTSARVSTDANVILNQLISAPLAAALDVILTVVTDFFEMVLGGWIIPAYQLALSASSQAIALALALGLIAAAIVILVPRIFRQIKWVPELETVKGDHWAREAIWVGSLGVLVTLLPVALTGRDVEYRIYYDRYTYQSIAPAAFLITGMIFAAIRSKWQVYVAGLLVFLAIFTHNLNASAYAQNWEYQKQVWWQYSWRAPGIARGTTLIVHMPPRFRYPEDFEIWAPASRIYYPGPGPLQITAEVLNAETVGAMVNRDQVSRNYRGVEFVRDFNQALVASMPTENSCLHVLDGNAPIFSPFEDTLIRQVAGISRLDRILTDVKPVTPPSIIFGKEPEHGWCYTYQKASLAQQQGDWTEIVRLADEAMANGLAPGDLVEYSPFFEGYLHEKRTADAARIALTLKEQAPTVAADLCVKFQSIENPDGLEIRQLAISLLCED